MQRPSTKMNSIFVSNGITADTVTVSLGFINAITPQRQFLYISSRNFSLKGALLSPTQLFCERSYDFSVDRMLLTVYLFPNNENHVM